jgi:hypothetical protein
VVEIAVATSTAPAQWWAEPDEILSTVLAVLEDRAKQYRR